MADSDFVQSGFGSFTPIVILDAPVDRLDTQFDYTLFNFQRPDPIEVGMAVMLGDEIMRVETVGILTFTAKRGCADTLPDGHLAGDVCWFFSQSTGTDRREYSASETIEVKELPFTTGGGQLPIDRATADVINFNWRYFRPYPPAQMKANNTRWFEPVSVTAAAPTLALSWVHRDRILQADQLLGQDDGTIGPEPGATYTMRVYDAADVLVRTEVGIQGTSYNYQWPQMVFDLGYPDAPQDATLHFTSTRDHLDSWQHYLVGLTVDPAGDLTSQFLPFDQRVIETTYQFNVMAALIPDGNYALAVAARPADRMSDAFHLAVDGVVSDVAKAYTPWATSDFRLPELEKTFNIRSSSLYDGVPIDLSLVGMLGMIDDEFVQVEAVGAGTFTLMRGCCDTIPAVHLPGAKLWLYEAAEFTDTTDRAEASAVVYKLPPEVYGPAVDVATLPENPITFVGRSTMPYPPGQLVVAGRPWFEEAQATSGTPTLFSWARRNRVTQGVDPAGHAVDDIPPEAGQQTRLQFYYTTPPTEAGAPSDVHILRSMLLTGTSYSYPYDLAMADGSAAGIATGVCGTVVVFVKIDSVRDNLPSLQSYTATIRLPSYPCAA